MDDEHEILHETRQRSYTIMQIAFCVLALGALAAGLAVHHVPAELGLSDDTPQAIANSFLFMGAAYVLTLFVWDIVSAPSE